MHPATEHVPPAQRLFAHLPRADQRRWAGVYLKGLLATQGKKSLRRIAASVTPSPTAAQSLQQFVNDSAWRWRPVRAELARWVAEHTAAHAWTLSPVVIPKRGELSAGVHRRFVPAFGRTVNCQLAVGAFLSGDLGDLSVDWRLYLPRRWTEDAALRHQARIPEPTGHATAADLCLALADQLPRITPEMPPVVVHTDGHIDAVVVIEGLGARGLDWVVGVPDSLPLSLAPAAAPHPADTAALHAAPEPAGALLRRHAQPAVTAPLAPGRPRIGTVRVLLPALNRPALLVGVWTGARPQPDRIWLTNLPPAWRALTPGRVAKVPPPEGVPPAPRRPAHALAAPDTGPSTSGTRACTRHAENTLPHSRRSPNDGTPMPPQGPPYGRTTGLSQQALAVIGSATAARVGIAEAELGLHDFAGRSYPGWHRHATLVSIASAHRRLGHEVCLAPGDS
ncbi:transposase [Streptomyces sp. NBC_00201]|uniref:IS701 family transposase n=1 Tax=unclassified Streptomyces TaxID=2593676 RepID=UPI002258AF33|nr:MULTISPECIES: transposase [unclassified Streptomyces]MCX5055505.1 transposase [Streptomyces sp. NBC_00452]MCX5247649.1 transposase [Streptomyces sp. NBC_00201]